ncbi:MAG: hypothetical protein J6C46_11890 [Clostridia bacterium]|nr:hypothetical protein [Clostridia bacterium]
MRFGNEQKGIFSKHFTRQLTSSFESIAIEKFEKFILALPGNSRYPYTDINFLTNEILDSFNIFYPLGVKIIYIVPTPDDDHYIEIGLLVRCFHKYND